MIPNELQQTIKARSEEFQGNTGLAEDSQRAIPSMGIDESMANADDSWGGCASTARPCRQDVSLISIPFLLSCAAHAIC